MRHLVGAHALSNEVSVFIHILADVMCDAWAGNKFIVKYDIRNCLYDHAT